MRSKANIYISEPIERVLELIADAIDRKDQTRSGRIASVCDRYLAMVADPVPTLGCWPKPNGLRSWTRWTAWCGRTRAARR